MQETLNNTPSLEEELNHEAEIALENENIENKLAEEEIVSSIKLDYTLQSPTERNELVKKIIEQTPPEKLTNRYLEILTDYIIFAMDKEERKKKKILTDNRMVTVNKREMSFEGLVGKLENGEDGIYNMLNDSKNIIFTPKLEITQKDIDEIPALKELTEEIKKIEAKAKAATGKKKFLLKKQLIEMYQDRYVIRGFYHQPVYCVNATKSMSKINLDENITIDENGKVHSDGLISLFNPHHVSALLCHYAHIKEDAWGKFTSDSYYLMEDLDTVTDKALKEKYPLYYDLVIYKIDGKTNAEIQELLYKDHGVKHSLEYISSLWRNKIPKLIAEQAEEDYLIWYYTTQKKGYWKKCNRCGQIKLGHNRFFSKNKTSKDGWYSICKCCRNKK